MYDALVHASLPIIVVMRCCSINAGMKLGWSTEHLVPEDDKLDLGVDVSLLQAPPDEQVTSQTQPSQKSSKHVIDENSLIEELQDALQGIVVVLFANTEDTNQY